MRKARGIALFTTIVIAVGATILALATPAAAVSTTYCVDAAGRSDTAAGTSTTAWKTLSKIDATAPAKAGG